MTVEEMDRVLRRALRGERLDIGELIDLRLAARSLDAHEVHNALTSAIESVAEAKLGGSLP